MGEMRGWGNEGMGEMRDGRNEGMGKRVREKKILNS